MPSAESHDPVSDAAGRAGESAAWLRRVVLVGNPNVGKSTLFSRLGGARAHASNFPGTTQATQSVTIDVGGRECELMDLPGVYELDSSEQNEAVLCRRVLASGECAVCMVLDATHLTRGLRLAASVMKHGSPMVVVVNRLDVAKERGVHVDTDALARRLGCPVVGTCATSGSGVRALREAMAGAAAAILQPDLDQAEKWAQSLAESVISAPEYDHHDRVSDRLDSVLLHPLLGTLVFVGVMTGLFWTVFKLATYPMDWIDGGFARFAGWVGSVLPDGAVSALLTDGVISGVGATVIFLPQICLMFFLIALLEQSGYLPRAALLVDRLLRPFGLPGRAFVPLLSSHACAIPGIIATRSIPDRRERLATILVAPLMSCSARIPVYVLLTSLLFADRPGLAAIAFAGCYVVGASAGLLTAVLVRRTLLRGGGRSFAMELSAYRLPSLRHATAEALSRGGVFLRKAGTVILAIVIVLWWLGEYPHSGPSAEAVEMRERAAFLTDDGAADTLLAEADRAEARHAKAHSFMGMAGRAAEPMFAPLGYDWQLTVGVLSSFAAREVFVSTMAVVLAADEDAAEHRGGLERIASATRADGARVFSKPTAWSLLVFFILAMQCLPTLAVTARESGGWKWAILQLGYMTVLAYGAAFVTYRVATGLLG